MASRVLWIGSRRPGDDGSRFLAAAGFEVAWGGPGGLHPGGGWPGLAVTLSVEAAPDVVVIALGNEPAARAIPRLLAMLPEGVKIVAVVPHPADLVPALVAGAHDAVAQEGAGDELYVRVLSWARAARAERQQRAALAAVLARAHQLEDDLAARQREVAELREETHRDDLTSLGNRRGFLARLEQTIEYARRYGGGAAVVVADLDGMKQLNDGFGHPAGDAALCTVAEVLRASLRSVDYAARLGGDEFGLVMPATSAAAAAQVADRIRRRIESVVLPGGLRLSASFGVAADPPVEGVPRAAADALVARADAALYAAKRCGRNRVEVDQATSEAA